MAQANPFHAQAVEAVHAIWLDWSARGLDFSGDEGMMQEEFELRLQHALQPWCLCIKPEYRPRILAREYTDWSRYDIAILHDDELIALLELSLGDTNVKHALHNGELKLLGVTGGIGFRSGASFATERGVSEAEFDRRIRTPLSSVPIRGLFFVGKGRVLDKARSAVWPPARPGLSGEKEFWSHLMAPVRRVTLHQVFECLSSHGLWCWFYSLAGEPKCEYSPIQQSSPLTLGDPLR